MSKPEQIAALKLLVETTNLSIKTWSGRSISYDGGRYMVCRTGDDEAHFFGTFENAYALFEPPVSLEPIPASSASELSGTSFEGPVKLWMHAESLDGEVDLDHQDIGPYQLTVCDTVAEAEEFMKGLHYQHYTNTTKDTNDMNDRLREAIKAVITARNSGLLMQSGSIDDAITELENAFATANVPMVKSIQSYLDVSTGHITREDSKILDELSDDSIVNNYASVVVHKYPEGYWVHVCGDDDEATVEAEKKEPRLSPSFWKAWRKTHDLKCWFMRLDADGDFHEDLDQHSW